MIPPHNYDYTFNNLSDEERIGKENTLNLDDKSLSKLLDFEQIMFDTSHIPLSFDSRMVEDSYYPSVFFYSIISNYVIVISSSTEFNTRLVENHLATSEWTNSKIEYEDVFKGSEKYLSEDFNVEGNLGSVFFAPGTNYKFVVDYEKLTELMERDPSLLIKLHPVSSDNSNAEYGKDFGYHRVIEKECSGDQVLEKAEKVYYTDNSEYGLKAMLKGIATDHVTRGFLSAGLPLNHLYTNLRKYNPEDQKKIVGHMMTSHQIGFFNINSSLEDLSSQFSDFMKIVEDLRVQLKPRSPRFSYKEWEDMTRLFSGGDCSCKDKKESKDD